MAAAALFVKIVISDAEVKGAIFYDPVVGCQPRIEEEQRRITDRVALQADLGGDHRARRRLLVDRTEGHGRKLRAVLAVEDHAVDRIGIGCVAYAVEHHVAHGDLSQKGLALGLGGNDAREPVEIVLIVRATMRSSASTSLRREAIQVTAASGSELRTAS